VGSAYGAGWHLPIGWLAWLATTDLRLWIYDQRALYGVIRFLHLVGVAGFVGGVTVIEFRRLSASAAAAVAFVRDSLTDLAHSSFAIVVLTGLWLFLRDPLGMGLHTMFLPKLALICAGAVYAHAIRKPDLIRRVMPARRAAALISILLWLTVVGFSTWNHVERPVNINAALRATSTGR
jgi:hypothetical protein